MTTRTKIALATALILGTASAALAADSGENHQDEGRAVISSTTSPANAGRAYGYAGKALRGGRGSYALAPLRSGPNGGQTSFENNWFNYQDQE
jgi:hypothetical protein